MVTRGGWEYVGNDGRLYKVVKSINSQVKTYDCAFSRPSSLPTSWVIVQSGSTYILHSSRFTIASQNKFHPNTFFVSDGEAGKAIGREEEGRFEGQASEEG